MGSMVVVMALNTDFGLILPYRKRFVERNNVPMTKKELPEPENRNDALAWHFQRIRGERSIEALRVQMKEAGYDIGAGTLWRLSRGDEGVRAASIKKLAAYAGKEPDELLRVPTTPTRKTAVPGPTPPGKRFDSMTADELQMLEYFRGMTDEDRSELTEEMRNRAERWASIVAKVLAETRAKQKT